MCESRYIPIIALVALFAMGCQDNGPALGKVAGLVTLDGKPLEAATVMFYPVAGGRTSEGVTDENGHYVIKYRTDLEGALLGEHRVSIRTYQEPETSDDGQRSGGRKELVPAKFNDESELRVTVEKGSATHDFELSS